ncbi:MAG TPA: hypothetical protein VF867_04380 [Arthrobacter sp.]
MSNQPFNAAQHPRIGDGTFTATAHSDAVPTLAAPAANWFAAIDNVRTLDAASSAALSPSGSNPEHDEAVRAHWTERRTQLVNRQQRKTYDDYAAALEEQAHTLLANAARANLRNIADELRGAFPDAATMTLAKDYDDGDLAIWVSGVQDADGNDLPDPEDGGVDARDTAQELISGHSSRQLARFTEGPVSLHAAASWHP